MEISFETLYSIILSICLSSCDYLYIVPDERPTEEDAFSDKHATENYLFSCYSFMPVERQSTYVFQTGEVVTNDEIDFLQGIYSAANVGNLEFWARLYGGIRRCYTLLNNIDEVPFMEESVKTVYKAEAKFLIAYYHFYILKTYGPLIIAEKEYDVDLPKDQFPQRAKFDDCVDWISTLMDECLDGMVEAHTSQYYGRATKTVNRAMKARLLLFAASPLFNGNAEFYANSLLDPETKEPLINTVYDQGKWERAYKACTEAIAIAEKNGFKLYEGKPTADMPYPEDPVQWSLRMAFIDRNNQEVIWGDTRREDYYGYQNACTPRYPDGGSSWNGVGPSLEIVKNFYTENGLPINVDPHYFLTLTV